MGGVQSIKNVQSIVKKVRMTGYSVCVCSYLRLGWTRLEVEDWGGVYRIQLQLVRCTHTCQIKSPATRASKA